MPLKMCEICEKRQARFVCQECGRQICEVCFEQGKWLCAECSKRLREEISVISEPVILTPFKLFFVGFAVVIVGILLLVGASFLSGAVPSVGGFVWIFPFPPILFGGGQEALWTALTAILLLVPLIVLLILIWRVLAR